MSLYVPGRSFNESQTKDYLKYLVDQIDENKLQLDGSKNLPLPSLFDYKENSKEYLPPHYFKEKLAELAKVTSLSLKCIYPGRIQALSSYLPNIQEATFDGCELYNAAIVTKQLSAKYMLSKFPQMAPYLTFKDSGSCHPKRSTFAPFFAPLLFPKLQSLKILNDRLLLYCLPIFKNLRTLELRDSENGQMFKANCVRILKDHRSTLESATINGQPVDLQHLDEWCRNFLATSQPPAPTPTPAVTSPTSTS